jgi:phosphopantothenoylcysteine decarboxylase/phosphopantothenate--cysteine ligase
VRLVGPVEGVVASGDVGAGRMAEPSAIAAALVAALAHQDLAGLRLVITAGPTFEDLDPVRFIGNRSSGRMGFAVAERAAARGAAVTLVAGPVELATPPGVRRVDVRSAAEMREALGRAMGADLAAADALIMAAAVADYTPAEVSPAKMKKSSSRMTLELVKTPDLLAEIGSARRGPCPVLVGFAVETGGPDALEAYARRKLADKRVDLVVANAAGDAFGREDNRAILVTQSGSEALPLMSKAALADVILERVRSLRPSSA